MHPQASRPTPNITWLVLDGPVDCLWVESLNSVLDDSRCFTVANGDRIPMTDRMKVVIETDDLKNASPTAVSRIGVVYVGEKDLSWKVLVSSWLATAKDKIAIVLQDIMVRIVTGDESPTAQPAAASSASTPVFLWACKEVCGEVSKAGISSVVPPLLY